MKYLPGKEIDFFLRVKAIITCLFIYLTWNIAKAHSVDILGEATD